MKRALTEQEFGRIGVDMGSEPLNAVLLISGAFDYNTIGNSITSSARGTDESFVLNPNSVDKKVVCSCNCVTGSSCACSLSNLVYIKGINIKLGQYQSNGTAKDLSQILRTCETLMLRVPRTTRSSSCVSPCSDCKSQAILSDQGIQVKILDRRFYDGYVNLQVEGSMSAALLPEVQVLFTTDNNSKPEPYLYTCTTSEPVYSDDENPWRYQKENLNVGGLLGISGPDKEGNDPPQFFDGFDIDFYPYYKDNFFISDYNPLVNNATGSIKNSNTLVVDDVRLSGLSYGNIWDELGSASLAFGYYAAVDSKRNIYLNNLISGNVPRAEIPDSFYTQHANVSGRFEGSKRGFTDSTYIGYKESYTSASICFASGTLKSTGNQVRRGIEPSLYASRYFTGSVFPLDTIDTVSFRITASISDTEEMPDIIRYISSSISTGSAAEPELLYYYVAPELGAWYRNSVLSCSINTTTKTGSVELEVFPYENSSKSLKIPVTSSQLTFESGGRVRFKPWSLSQQRKVLTQLADSGSLAYNLIFYPKNKTVPDKNDIIYRYLSGSFHRLPDSIIYLPDTDRILTTDIFGKVVDVVVAMTGSVMDIGQ